MYPGDGSVRTESEEADTLGQALNRNAFEVPARSDAGARPLSIHVPPDEDDAMSAVRVSTAHIQQPNPLHKYLQYSTNTENMGG